jgi:hypothetical protein
VSHLTESESPGHEQLIFPCDCHDCHYLRVAWDDEDSECRYLWIEHNERPRGWERVRSAVKALRGKSVLHGEIILTDESVASLVDFLTEKTDGR